jgi:hypothetical protein
MAYEEFDHEEMIPAPAGVTAPRTIYKSEDGILLCYGTSQPTTASTYAPGCILINTSTGKVYVNITTTFTSAASWSVIGSVTS